MRLRLLWGPPGNRENENCLQRGARRNDQRWRKNRQIRILLFGSVVGYRRITSLAAHNNQVTTGLADPYPPHHSACPRARSVLPASVAARSPRNQSQRNLEM